MKNQKEWPIVKSAQLHELIHHPERFVEIYYMTIPEVLEALAISRATYYRLVQRGILHPKRGVIGGVRVPREEVDAILVQE